MKMNVLTKQLLYLIAILIAVGTVSCRKDLELPEIKADNKIVLLGELVAGDTIYLRGGQSATVSKNSDLRFKLLDNLSVSVKDGGIDYTLNSKADSFAQTLYTYPYTLNRNIMPGSTYTITAVHKDLGTAAATVYIPAQIQADVLDTATTLYSTDTTLRVRIRINDPANTSDKYVIEVLKQKMDIKGYFKYNNIWIAIDDDRDFYEQLKANGNVETRFDTTYYKDYIRQALYTADMNSDNVLDNGAFTRSRRILLKDLRFNGTSYETDVFVVKNNPNTTFEEPKGRIIIYIKSVSEDYYKFLKSYEMYDPTAGYTSLEQPVKIQGNITNGLGVIGGVSQVKFVYMTDIWNF